MKKGFIEKIFSELRDRDQFICKIRSLPAPLYGSVRHRCNSFRIYTDIDRPFHWDGLPIDVSEIEYITPVNHSLPHLTPLQVSITSPALGGSIDFLLMPSFRNPHDMTVMRYSEERPIDYRVKMLGEQIGQILTRLGDDCDIDDLSPPLCNPFTKK